MKPKTLPILFAVAMAGCASEHWRARTVESASNPKSQVFEVNRILFGKDLNVRKFRLSNGLKVLVMEDHSAPVFAYHTWFNVGSRNERDGSTGIAHLFEHLMFKETKNLKEGEFDRILEEQGGKVNAATYVDWTFYRESLPVSALPLIPKLEADRMRNMTINDAQVNSERDVVANERRFRTENSPSGLMFETLYKAAFTKHPYRWPVIGWMKDIQGLTTAECLKFHSTYYAPNNATLVIVGDVRTEEILRLVNEAYGPIQPSDIPREALPAEPKQTDARKIVLEQTIPADKLVLGHKIPDALHSDFAPLQVLSSILFEGRSSRLFRRLITDMRIASEAGGWVNQTRDPSLFVIDVTMRPGRTAQEALKVIDEELLNISAAPVPPRELEKAKNRLETSFWGNFRAADDKAQALGFYEIVTGDYRNLFGEVPGYHRVTAADVLRVAKTYFVPSTRTTVIAVPRKSPPS